MPMGLFFIWPIIGLVTYFSRHVLEIINNKLFSNRTATRGASQCGLLNLNFSYNLEVKKKKLFAKGNILRERHFFNRFPM